MTFAFKYRSAVGMMLFLMKYSRTDISNAVRELSKPNNKANYAYYKQMLQAVTYILKTRNRMLKFIPTSETDKWEFKCMCDSDYARDKGPITVYYDNVGAIYLAYNAKI